MKNQLSIIGLVAVSVLILFCESILVFGQQCTSNYISSFTPTDSISSKASGFTCPTGFVNGFNLNGNRTCLSITNTILPQYLGMSCAGSSTVCAANWLGCAAKTQTCEQRRTRILGDYCTHRENCLGSFGSSSAFTNCYKNRCVSFKVQNSVATEGAACQDRAFDEDNNIIYDCAPGFYCYSSVCQKVTYDSDEGGKCETVENNIRVNCKQNQGLTCINYVCYRATLLTLGQNCTGVPTSTICGNGLYCRKENPTSAAKTCQPPSVYGEFCESASDCYKLPILQMRCARNKCIRRFALLDGESCDKNDDCFNNYCDPTTTKCSSAQLTCSTAKSCPSSSDLKCGCGGSSSASSFNGTCVQPCNGYREDFYACAYNNGVDELTSGMTATYSTSQPVDSNSTIINSICSKEYANMIKCYKKAWSDAGMYDTSSLTSLSGVDVTGQPIMPSVVTVPIVGRNLTSPSPKVSANISEANLITTNLSMLIALLIVSIFFSM